MYLTPYTSLTWAYQLHYYICFRTHRRHASLDTTRLLEIFNEICARDDYHLLECQPHPNQVRCLFSLHPTHTISKTVQTVKCNSSRVLALPNPTWARGYLARSVGTVRLNVVREYLEHQSEHHGYDGRILPPVYRYHAKEAVRLTAAHCCFELSHHVVLATRWRKGVFDSTLAAALSEYWLTVASARGFAIDQISIVPDHVHMIVRIVPSMSIEQCALLLMNNGQYFVWKNYGKLLVGIGLDQLWESSAYVGTRGDYTTALIKAWLRKKDE